jgi:hypothetical protein
MVVYDKDDHCYKGKGAKWGYLSSEGPSKSQQDAHSYSYTHADQKEVETS